MWTYSNGVQFSTRASQEKRRPNFVERVWNILSFTDLTCSQQLSTPLTKNNMSLVFLDNVLHLIRGGCQNMLVSFCSMALFPLTWEQRFVTYQYFKDTERVRKPGESKRYFNGRNFTICRVFGWNSFKVIVKKFPKIYNSRNLIPVKCFNIWNSRIFTPANHAFLAKRENSFPRNFPFWRKLIPKISRFYELAKISSAEVPVFDKSYCKSEC